jgi:hypothetical protein
MADDTQAQLPAPALQRLDRFVGTWSMEGHLVGADETVNVPYDIGGRRRT